MTVTRVQLASGTYNQTLGPPTSVAASWPAPTTAGNTLIAVLGISLVSSGSGTYIAPSGWVEVDRIENATNCAISIYVIEQAASRSGSETFSIAGVARDTVLHIIEYSSTNPLAMVATGTGNTGTGTTAATDALTPPASGSLLRIGALANRNNSTLSNPGNGFTEIVEAMSPNATAGNRVNCAVLELLHTSSAALAASATISSSRPWAALGIILAETAPATPNDGTASGSWSFAGAAVGAAPLPAGAVVNLVPNPSFEVGTTGWSSWQGQSTLSRDSTYGGASGSWALKATFTAVDNADGATSGAIPVVGGTTYHISAHAYLPTLNGTSLFNTPTVAVTWLTSGGGFAGFNLVATGPNTQDAWVRHGGSATAPANAASAVVRVGASPTVDVTAGYGFFIDAVQVTATSDLEPYFDGSTTDGGGYDYEWTGTPHNSASLRLVVAEDPSEGTASGSFAFAGTATGKRVARATGAGAWGFAGTATGARASRGVATGTLAFTGTAAGKRATRGTASGAFTFTGTATGKKAARGTAEGSVAWSSNAVGSAPTVGGADGSASGAVAWGGVAVGRKQPRGTTSGVVAYTGTAVGGRTVTGSASGAVTWVGTAAGKRVTRGTATGLRTYAGTATGRRPAKAAASSGSVEWTGAATGARTTHATAVGNVAWSGEAAGKMAATGVGAGETTWVGVVVGASQGLRDVTFVVGQATRYPLDVGAATRHPLTVGRLSRHPLTIETPRK